MYVGNAADTLSYTGYIKQTFYIICKCWGGVDPCSRADQEPPFG